MSDKPHPTEEPPADLRHFASMMRSTYVALVQEGFTAAEALTIVSEIIRANLGGKA